MKTKFPAICIWGRSPRLFTLLVTVCKILYRIISIYRTFSGHFPDVNQMLQMSGILQYSGHLWHPIYVQKMYNSRPSTDTWSELWHYDIRVRKMSVSLARFRTFRRIQFSSGKRIRRFFGQKSDVHDILKTLELWLVLYN